MYEKLFSPCNIGTLTIPNRIVFEPLQNYLAQPDGKCSDQDTAFYVERAKGGVGLIQTGTICVDLKTGRANRHVLALDRDDQIGSFRDMTDAVHRQGTYIFAELFHPGRQGSADLNGGVVLAPSETVCGFMQQPTRAMTMRECELMAEKFISAAVRAKNAGFDGVTLHCAHGYLLQEFLSPYTNLRTDVYGGSLDGRGKIVTDIISGIRSRCGSLPISVRLCGDEFLDTIGLPKNRGITPDLAAEYARLFEAAGADAIDVSAGLYETMNTSWEPSGYPQGWKAHLAKTIRRKVTVPVICTSVIREPAFAEQLLADGVCDFVGSARTFLADPKWPLKARRGREDEITPCISCLHCFDTLLHADETGETISCTVNPEACRELCYSDPRADGRGRTVVIVGGGIAGMEAARTLALRRFDAVLLETSDTLGGQLILAQTVPSKERLGKLLDWYRRQMKLLRLDVRLNTEAAPELIRSFKPDAVIIATGAVENQPDFPVEGDIYSVSDILKDKVELGGKRVIVIGAGPTGMEISDYLAQKGSFVTLCDANNDLSGAMYFQNYQDLSRRLDAGGVQRRLGKRVIAVERCSCILEGGESLQADAVVLALGTRPNHTLAEDVRSICDHVVVVGDAAWGRNCSAAIRGAHETAYHLLEHEYGQNW